MPTENPPSGYTLLDSGNMQKLERVGPYLLVRPSPQAIWSPQLSRSEWEKADGTYVRTSEGGGHWNWHNKVKREFDLLFNTLSFEIHLTNFGHMGLFPEHATHWGWLRDLIRNRLRRTNDRNLHVLNLFAYTGGSSLAASQAGAHVVHLDAARNVVEWARKNAHLSGLQDRPIRWLVDDATKFINREQRRRARYQAIILDPPSFGRGPQGEVFKIEKDLMPLLEACSGLLAPDALFVLYTSHTPGFTPITMHNQLTELVDPRKGNMESGEMVIEAADGRRLPSGAFARWSAADL